MQASPMEENDEDDLPLIDLIDLSWHVAKDILEKTGPNQTLVEDFSTIDSGALLLNFMTMPTNGTVVALGWGTGAWPLRAATWGGGRTVICVEPNNLCRSRASNLVKRLQFADVLLVPMIGDLLPAGSKVDFAILHPSYTTGTFLREFVESYNVDTLVGAYLDQNCSDSDIFRISCAAKRFDLLNRTSGKRIVGRHRDGPEVSVLVLEGTRSITDSEQSLNKTVSSLLAQLDVELEIILAFTQGSPYHEAAKRWSESHPGQIRMMCSEENVVNRALNQARGLYVNFLEVGESCSPSMFTHMFADAAPRMADILVSGYCELLYLDGTVEPRFTFARPAKDLRNLKTMLSQEIPSLLDLAPVLGRYLFRREYLIESNISWPQYHDRFASALFVASCLCSSTRVSTSADTFLLHPQSYEEAIGTAHRLEQLETIRAIADAITSTVLSPKDFFSHELQLRHWLFDLHLRLYYETSEILAKIRILRSLISYCFARLIYGSNLTFFLQQLKSYL